MAGKDEKEAGGPLPKLGPLGLAILDAPERVRDNILIVDSLDRPSTSTFAEIVDKARSLADGLQVQGIGNGSRVAVQLPAWADAVILHSAIAMLGATVIPLGTGLGHDEIEFIARQAGFDIAITTGKRGDIDYSLAMSRVARKFEFPHFSVLSTPDAENFERLYGDPHHFAPPPSSSETLFMIVYTSGTTAEPKGVKHSQASWFAELQQNVDPELRPVLSPWPPGHVAGCLSLSRFAMFGQPTVLMDRWDPNRAAALIEERRIYATSGTPLHLGGLLDAAEDDDRDLSSLKSYLAGATTIPSALISRCAKTGLATYRCYGSSEHPTVSAGTPDDPLSLRQKTDGRLLEGVEVRIVDDDGRDLSHGTAGEIWTRGPDLFLGYLDEKLNEESFAPGRWYKTGDIGTLDADHNLTITDRKKDVIIRGGETLSSREIEDHIAAMDSVAEVACIAVSDQRHGEKVCAIVRLRSGTKSLSLEELNTHFRERGIARVKTPEHVMVVEDFPRTASGKIQKAELRRAWTQENS